MLFKVGNKFHFLFFWKRWVCKGQLKTFFIRCSLPWSHLGVWMLNNWKPSSFQWVVMAIMCFTVFGVGIFTQMKKNVVPFFMRIHCFVHWINLVVLVLSKLSLLCNWKPSCMFYVSFYFIHLRNSLNFRACVMCL